MTESPAPNLNRWLDAFERDFLVAEKQLCRASWAFNTRSNPDTERVSEEAERAYRGLLADSSRYDAVRQFSVDATTPPLDARRHNVARRLLGSHRMDESLLERLVPRLVALESKFHRFRAELRGKKTPDNELRDVLRSSSDSDLVREAWEASKQIGTEVASEVIEIARLRNEVARSNGFSDYQSMALEMRELPPHDLFEILDAVAESTEAPFRAMKRELDDELGAKFEVDPSELMPWHYGDPFFQSAPRSGSFSLDPLYADCDLAELTRRYFAGIGLDIDSMLAASDLYEREHKCQHAFCTHIDRRDDVRVLCNIRPNEEWMSTMLHEFGHAVYDRELDPELPGLLREPAHTLTTEAIAMLFGRLSRDPSFLTDIVGVDAATAQRASEPAREELRRGELVFMRWALVVVYFERELYRDPSQDLDAVWWDLVARFQLLSCPPGRPAPDWATKIHVAVHPVYYQNYILGNLAASQIGAALQERVLDGNGGLVGNPAIGEFLTTEVFRPGNRASWNELIRSATGEELTPRHFIEEFS